MQYWHGSFISDKEKIGILVIGPPNVGKTELCYYFVNYFNYYLIADDLVMLEKKNKKYQGFLCNKNYLGILHRKQKGFIRVKNSLPHAVISHVVYLYCQKLDKKYYKKAHSLSLPVITINMYKNARISAPSKL